MSDDLLRLGVAGLCRLYRRGDLSPVDVAHAALARAESLNPQVNALCHMDRKTTLAMARASEKRWRAQTPRGPLDGVTATFKDWSDVRGWPTRMGSCLSSPAPARADSPPVARLREAGAVFIGKTTLPEFGHKGVTDSPLTGMTRNPWDLRKTSGGSSGGAAASAAAGFAVINMGSDAGGSVRIPASFCGVFGFKPSPGLVPAFPPSLFSTLSAAGPLTRTVADAAAALDAVTVPDTRDWHAVALPPQKFAAGLRRPLPPLRIGWADSFCGMSPAADVAAVFDAFLPALKKLGRVEHVALEADNSIEVFNRHWMAVASRMVAAFTPAQRKKMDPRLLHWAARGDKMSLHDYLDAERARMDIGAYFKTLLTRYDVLVTPTTLMTAFDVGTNMPRDKNGKLWDDWTPFTYPANLAKLPAASLPIGLTPAGLPVGAQVMAGNLKDAFLLRVCHKLENIAAFPSWAEAGAEKEI